MSHEWENNLKLFKLITHRTKFPFELTILTTATDDPSTLEIEGILYNTDWQDAIYRTAISTDHNSSAKLIYMAKFHSEPIGYTKMKV